MSYSAAVLADSPNAYWHLDETTGTAAADASGNAHAGTYVNSPTLAQTSLVPTGEGTSVSFAAGSSQLVTCTGGQVYGTTGYSIEFWVKANSAGAGNFVFYGEGNSGQANTILQLESLAGANSSKLTIFLRNDAGTTLLSNVASVASIFPASPGVPTAHHVVFTDSNGAWKLYIDGALDSSGTYTPSTLTTNTAAIGALIRNTTNGFATGTVDEVAVYKSVLSLTQVQNHFNATAGSAPSNTVAPAVTGTAAVGSTLTTNNGTWTGSPTGYSYQWTRNGSNIASATASTYTLVDADDATTVLCVVTATNASGSASANSNSNSITEPVATNSVAPVASGTAAVNSTVSATTGTWANMGGTVATYAYQWQDSANGTTGWANVTGATSSNYTIAVGELNKYLRCNVTATNTGGTSSATSSNVLGPVAAAATTSYNLGLAANGGRFLRMKGIR